MPETRNQAIRSLRSKTKSYTKSEVRYKDDQQAWRRAMVVAYESGLGYEEIAQVVRETGRSCSKQAVHKIVSRK